MTAQEDALAPLQEVLLARAQEYAGRVRADAEAAATRTLGKARTESTQILEAAREQGAADAEEVLAGQRARVRGQVRALVLQAQRVAYDDLRRTACADARHMVADDPGLTARLGALGRDRLGPDATVTAEADGTVVVELGGRRWSWSPDALAQHAVDELGEAVEQLWAP